MICLLAAELPAELKSLVVEQAYNVLIKMMTPEVEVLGKMRCHHLSLKK